MILSEDVSRNYVVYFRYLQSFSQLNDTLDDNLCENAGDSDDQTNAWLAIYAPTITARINDGAPGANVSNDDTYSLLSMCPFDSVAKEKRSPFCDMFDAADFEGFEYSGDLDKYYGTGFAFILSFLLSDC